MPHRLALPLLALLALSTPVAADDASPESEPEDADDNGSYACQTSGSTSSGQVIIFHEDPLTVGVSTAFIPGEERGEWVGISIYPQGNGPCLIVDLGP